MAAPPEVGAILLVALGRHVPPGHEQEGRRPAVVVAIPDRVATPRFPMLIVVPLTTQGGEWAAGSPVLYPSLKAGTGSLPNDSIALLDNVRAVDPRRVLRRLGTLTEQEIAPIIQGLRLVFDQPESRPDAELVANPH